jgi:hypothetical protein
MNLRGYMPMIFSILGLVALSALFIPIMNALAGLYDTPGASNFTLLQLVITIVPTILILALSVGLGFSYYTGFKQMATQDANGLISMVVGVMAILLFITMFGTVITNFSSLYTNYGTNTTWIAFGTVLTIVPTILFLGGLFGGGLLAFSGGKRAFNKYRGKGGGAAAA